MSCELKCLYIEQTTAECLGRPLGMIWTCHGRCASGIHNVALRVDPSASHSKAESMDISFLYCRYFTPLPQHIIPQDSSTCSSSERGCPSRVRRCTCNVLNVKRCRSGLNWEILWDFRLLSPYLRETCLHISISTYTALCIYVQMSRTRRIGFASISNDVRRCIKSNHPGVPTRSRLLWL